MSVPADQPFGWEYLYFSDLLTDEVESSRSQQQEPESGTDLLNLDAGECLAWLSGQMAPLASIPKKITSMLNEILPIALGPKGSSGDPDEIKFVVSQLGDAYRAALQWPFEWRSVRTDSRWAAVLREGSLLTSNMLAEFEEFAARLAIEVPDGIARAQQGEPVRIEFTLTLTMPSTDAFDRELASAKLAFGIA